MYSFTDGATFSESGITFSIYGRLAIDLLTCEKIITIKNQSSN